MPWSTDKCAQPPQKRPRVATPRAADIRITYDEKPYSEPILVAPPKSVVAKLCATTPKMVLGYDIETHDWLVDGAMQGRIGDFGCYATIDEGNLKYQRIVQLGWVVGKVDVDGELALSKEYLVKPEGFDISTKATGHHKINHSKAVEEGRPLRDVLEEFMQGS